MEKDGIFGHSVHWPEEPSWHLDGGAAHFESALSSMVSSPSSSAAPAAVHVLAIRELIGRLGSICSSDPADAASCYATPLPSPLALAAADPAFAERAARLSSFGAGVFSEPGKLSRVSSSRSMRLSADQESSVVSDPNSAGESSGRKRKAAAAPPKGKAKNATSSTPIKMEVDEDSSAKRSRSSEAKSGEAAREAAETKPERNGGGPSKRGKEKEAKPPETPKQDYIHVRARRGQATDRHSLAERVRREKISERMKLLQDLVPGCNKIIGKAVMLDEIINYVQSLQCQVEFLSMKLATLNPQLDLSMETLFQKDIQMHQSCGPPPNSVHLLEASATGFVFPHQPQQGMVPLQFIEPAGVESQGCENQLGFTLPRTLSVQLSSLDGFVDAASHHGTFLENDLQNFVQMGFGQNQEAALASQSFHGQLPTAQ